MELLDSLQWRYATKKYSNRKLEHDKLQQIIEAIRLSPSSAGMQPYHVVLIEDEALREELSAGSFNAQIKEASHLLVFAAQSSITETHINEYIRYTASERHMDEAQLEPFRASLTSHLLSRTDEENFVWASRQAYIALGTGIIAAASLQIDATPMEGFDATLFDDRLGLTEKGYKSVVLLALGIVIPKMIFLPD